MNPGSNETRGAALADIEAMEVILGAQEAALGQLAPGEPLSPSLRALLAAPLPRLSVDQLSLDQRARLMESHARVGRIVDELSTRQRGLRGRIAAVRQARTGARRSSFDARA